ncbi:MAG: hypothetical protein DMG98_04115 [Acidobacteria bacterium]|nr:MAG: hypothetical protein DMG98_04115 [Acidobacteriota bacterium]
MRCECKLGIRAKKLIENAGIPPRYESCTLETYRAESSKPSLVNAKAKALKFVEQYPIDKTGLIFVGKAGEEGDHVFILQFPGTLRKNKELLRSISADDLYGAFAPCFRF